MGLRFDVQAFSNCSARASHRGGSSCRGAWSQGTQAPVLQTAAGRSTSSAAVAHSRVRAPSATVPHGLSYYATRVIFLHPRSNSCPLRYQLDFYPLYHQGSLPQTINEISELSLYKSSCRCRICSTHVVSQPHP